MIERRLLVTGGCGFVGTNFIRFILRRRPNWTVINLDSLTYCGNPENLADIQSDPRYTFHRGDIKDRKLVEHLLTLTDHVVHFAAESHVDRSIVDSRPFIETNVLGTHCLLEAVRSVGNIRFINVGTDEVYGSLALDQPGHKFSETSPIKPSSPYSASKAAGDLLTLSYHHTYGLDAVITRCSNNFGPYQFPEKVIPLFVTNLLEARKVPVYGDGRNVRDWIHVDDHCEAILAVLERGRSGEIYNIGGSNEQSNLDLAQAILNIMEVQSDMIDQVSDRLGHDLRYAIDASKIQTELGWTPSRSSWPSALERTVRWYIDNEAWWRQIKTINFERNRG